MNYYTMNKPRRNSDFWAFFILMGIIFLSLALFSLWSNYLI